MRFVLLALLSRGPVHGYELKRSYDELFGPVWPPINIGQIYVTMGRLERDGLVEMTPQEGRKLYHLTTLGRKELRAWVSETVDPAVQKSDLLLRLVAAALVDADGNEARSLIADHRRRCLLDLKELDASIADTPTGSLAELLVQQASLHLQAELRWLDLAEQRLAAGPIRLPERATP